MAWKKGLTLDEVQELIARVPMPFIAHFRVPSCGGPSEFLTHPFPIQKDVPLDIEGSTKGSVLFHNGHWNSWKQTMLDASVRGSNKLPVGKWSDSRAMAWMAANYGIGMLEFIDEKCVVFGPKELELFGQHGWAKIRQEGGIWVSNKGWEHERVDGKWTRPPYYGNPPARGTEPKTDGKSTSGASDDKEDHTRDSSQSHRPALVGQKGPMAAGSGIPHTSLTPQESTGTSPELRSHNGGLDPKGGSIKHRPLELYLSAVRLWKGYNLSTRKFKAERKKYEQWCREQKRPPQPRPDRDIQPLGQVH